MAYRSNPFVGRTSERTTSDQEFVRLFSPKILEKLPDEAFEGAVHVFRSPPGGGKTTLLRAFTPTALRAFWSARRAPEMEESFQRLVALRVLCDTGGPQSLGVLLSCASGYADLPPGAPLAQAGLFRALLDCRVVLRTLRSLAALLGTSSVDSLIDVTLEYSGAAQEIKSIPLVSSASELTLWAEERERSVYAQLDSIEPLPNSDMPVHVRFESVLWLQGVTFVRDGKILAPQRLLMIDDLHKLRRKQRDLLIEELVELRPRIPIWLAERSIALGPELISQGAREGRDLHQFDLEELWAPGRGQYQFAVYAQNILERRLATQNVIPPGSFGQYLRSEFQHEEMKTEIQQGINNFIVFSHKFKGRKQYEEWFVYSDRYINEASVESLNELYSTLILIARNENKRQLSLELMPLTAQELEGRDSSQVQSAAEIFLHENLKIPYYYGIERLCVMATNNVEELLSLAAVLYDALQAKQVLRRPELLLSPQDQEKALVDAAKKKREFIPKAHTDGSRAQKLLDAIGSFCREKTFVANAPYAPGVTGVRLSETELNKLSKTHGTLIEQFQSLKTVVSECVAENLLLVRSSTASASRESGTVFYLNRTLCACFGLPLQMGGWQDVKAQELVMWMQHGRKPNRKNLLEIS
jgi:hypothetical protein